jgi:thioredoxin reductase
VSFCNTSRGKETKTRDASPELFKGKKVIVVGMGNTGADTAAALVGIADRVSISHNHGAIVVSLIFYSYTEGIFLTIM